MRATPALLAALLSPLYPAAPSGAQDVIYACAHHRTGVLRVAEPGTCRAKENPIQWNAAGVPGPAGPAGPPGPAATGTVAFLRSAAAVTTVAGGDSVEVPGLGATLPVADGARLWIQGDFHEHRFCDGYLDRSHLTASWALDLEIDGTIVASREMRGEQGSIYNHESKPFTWVTGPLAGGDHSIRFLLRPPETDTVGAPPYQAKICLGTDGTDERDSRVVILELPWAASPRPSVEGPW